MGRQSAGSGRKLPGVDPRQVGDKSYESENLYMLAVSCLGDRGIGDFELARRSVNMALDISRTARMDGHTAPALLVAGNINGCTGDYQKGFDLLNEALAWSQNLAVIRFQTSIYFHLGYLYREINLYDKAQEADAVGLRIAKDHGVGYQVNGLRAGLAIDLLHLGDLDVEQELLETYERTRQQNQGMHGLLCLEGLTEWALATGELQAALDYSQRSEELAQAGGMRENLGRARKLKGEVLVAMGDFEAAEQELESAKRLADEIKGVRLGWTIRAALAKLYRAWGKDARANEHQTGASEIVARILKNLADNELKVGLQSFAQTGG
jgi:tetratricopeptide (TPR) repeat protein